MRPISVHVAVLSVLLVASCDNAEPCTSSNCIQVSGTYDAVMKDKSQQQEPTVSLCPLKSTGVSLQIVVDQQAQDMSKITFSVPKDKTNVLHGLSGTLYVDHSAYLGGRAASVSGSFTPGDGEAMSFTGMVRVSNLPSSCDPVSASGPSTPSEMSLTMTRTSKSEPQ